MNPNGIHVIGHTLAVPGMILLIYILDRLNFGSPSMTNSRKIRLTLPAVFAALLLIGNGLTLASITHDGVFSLHSLGTILKPYVQLFAEDSLLAFIGFIAVWLFIGTELMLEMLTSPSFGRTVALIYGLINILDDINKNRWLDGYVILGDFVVVMAVVLLTKAFVKTTRKAFATS